MITPDRQTVAICLKQKHYHIDFYQREYVWEKGTVDRLLDDIFYAFELSYAEYKDVDLSKEVIEKFNWYYLNIFITNKVGSKTYIVDGQQRLSTLTLIATKLYGIIEDSTLRDILKECIFGKDPWQGNIFWLDNDKRKYVMECILEGRPYANFKNKTEETLMCRYKDINDYIDRKQLQGKKLTAFVHYFLERLILVELNIDKDDTPMIFEVINDRGEALKPFEILKGKLVGALNKQDTESYSEKWDDAISQLRGIEDAFFTDFIKAKFIYKRNSKIETSINNAYHRYLFEDNEVAEKLGFRKKDRNQIISIKEFIDRDLKYYSTLYARIRQNNNDFLQYNNEINSLSGQYQNIMAACRVNDSMEELKIASIAKEIDRLYILLILNGIYDSNEFQEISYRLNEELPKLDVSEYRDLFDNIIAETVKEKRNLDNVSSILDYEVFKHKNYTNINIRLLRYYLARIEKYICDKINQSMQHDVPYIATKTGDKTAYHIEHILSKNDTNKSYFSSEEEFDERRNMLGGLLLLKDRNNISSSNEEYIDKLKTYSNGLVWGHSLCGTFYHCNKEFDDFNNELHKSTGVNFKSVDQFDRDALDYRTRLLYQITKLVWEF